MKHKSIILHRRPGRFASILHGLMAWLVLNLSSGAAAPANPAGSDPSQNTQPIPWNELGAKATAQYSGDGLAVNATADGARLRCVFQKLEGEVTPQGLWLSSTAPGSSNTPFRVLATSLGREREEHRALSSTGTVETSGGVARFIRPGLIEEYSVSVDGLRQDFVLPERLPGEGTLRVELKVAGATAEASPDGVRLVLESSGRKLNYHRLRATDATGRELAARMEVSNKSEIRNPKSEIGLAVMVEDGGAVYPVRIDPTFSDANWTSMGGIRGANDWVTASVMDAAGNLYIGGFFSLVGDVFANRIAKWDGSHWSTLGSGMEGVVSALAVLGTDLYAGGGFSTAGGIPANSIARWNGSSWSALGSGLNGGVTALAISGSDLYASGSFTTAGDIAATNIAKWNGSSWSALGSGLNSGATALAISGTNLYAGGWFTRAGDVAATNVAKWNGSGWSALGSGMAMGTAMDPGINSAVFALAVSGSDLYAAGYFRTAGGTPANSIAKWNGSSWSALDTGLSVYFPDPEFPYYDVASVYALVVSGTNLYAGGSIEKAGGTDVNSIARWNGSSWSAVGPVGSFYGPGGDYTYRSVNTLVLSGSHLYVAGWFSIPDDGSKFVAEWNGTNWSGLPAGVGMNGFVVKLAVSGSDLYAAGSFTTPGGDRVIAKWNGTGWSVLDSGGRHLNPSAALAVSGSEVFTVEYSIPFGDWVRVVKWNGSSWSALGSGMPSGGVSALVVSGTDLYAAGWFTTAGGIAATNIAKWNGNSWSALGSGINNSVSALAVSGTDLYAVGNFTMAGGIPATNIAKWNGNSWSALGSGISAPPGDPYDGGRFYALAASGGDLYAGGWFTTAGGIPADNIAKWNGSSWSALGSGISAPLDEPYNGGTVYALVAAGGDLYAAGTFTTAGGIAANSIAKWNGSSWSALGSGVSGVPGAWLPVPTVWALAVAGADLYAGGYFITAGDKVSGNIARVRIGSAARSIEESSGSALIQFSGVTGYEYDVQRATSLTPPIGWTTVTTSPLSPADNGSFTFTDTNAPAGTAYYRAMQR